jgi:hypothetical protein
VFNFGDHLNLDRDPLKRLSVEAAVHNAISFLPVNASTIHRFIALTRR